MKKYLLLAIFIISILGLQAQTNEEEQVKQIREWFVSINNKKQKFEKKIFDMPDEATEGATLTAYYGENEIVLLEAEFYGETGNYKSFHYYWNGILFFVFTITEKYSSHIMDENNTIASKEENRYYFWEGKMIRWLDSQKAKVSKISDIFKTEETRILEYTNELYRKTQQYTHD